MGQGTGTNPVSQTGYQDVYNRLGTMAAVEWKVDAPKTSEFLGFGPGADDSPGCLYIECNRDLLQAALHAWMEHASVRQPDI